MSNTLVAYFSAGGTTKKAAAKVAEAAGADLYEIRPKVPYTDADLNWMDKKSRSSIEMSDKSFRPEIAGNDAHIEKYDTILIGFPIWWYVAPTIINTFLESYDFSEKRWLFLPHQAAAASAIRCVSLKHQHRRVNL